jgi:hypothetical protein
MKDAIDLGRGAKYPIDIEEVYIAPLLAQYRRNSFHDRKESYSLVAIESQNTWPLSAVKILDDLTGYCSTALV